jgi:hypothetical protein
MPQLSIQGISHGRFSNFFPISVRGLTMVMGVYSPRNGESFTIEFRHSDGTKAFDFVVKINDIQTYDPAVNEFREVNEVEAAAVGKMRFSLEYRRTGLHGVLGRNLTPADETTTTFIKLYETTKLEADCREFKTLLEADSPEQKLQDFLEKNLIFFSRFSALRLIPKPQIQGQICRGLRDPQP